MRIFEWINIELLEIHPYLKQFKSQKNIETAEKSIQEDSHGHSHIVPVGWIIFLGESLHIFFDGVSIGCAFNQGILIGFSLSIPILCESIEVIEIFFVILVDFLFHLSAISPHLLSQHKYRLLCAKCTSVCWLRE